MAVNLRPYQQDLWDKGETARHEQNARNICAVLPTGGGKTWLLARAADEQFPTCTIAHRQELLGQITTTFAEAGISHRIIAPQPVINFCIERQVKHVGRSFYHPQAPASVAGIDTLIRRHEVGDKWAKTIRRWSIDECHHTLGVNLTYEEANKWGKGCQLFTHPQVQGFGVTATPIRADRRSLHLEQGGAFDTLVQGLDMRTLIEQGSLCDYRVIASQVSIDEALLKIGTSGEFTDNSRKKALERSQIVGDVVETYLQHTPGKQGIVFAAGTEDAEKIAAAFRARGVAAVALDGTTNDTIRQTEIEKFVAGQTKILVNVGLFDEGFDVPAVEVCIMASPTNSFGRFCQQIGRALRPAPGKQFGIIIDHVGNVLRMAAKHGMPDTPRKWPLWLEQGRRKTGEKDPWAIPLRACPSCTLAYEALQMQCPYCGAMHEPLGRNAPEQVDGILAEMSPQLLQQLRMAKAQIDKDRPAIPNGASEIVAKGIINRHRAAQETQHQLRQVMEMWGGVRLAAGDSDTQMQSRFQHMFGIDVLSAQALKTKDAQALIEKVRQTMI